ncbi:hypothetical protein SUGI_0675240 [Cryptomeria japonica]|nr:hypothetical protein SUGI_0675240 [Cryptomeria japonica]
MAPVQLRELVIFNCHNFQRFPNFIGCLKELRKIVVGGGSNSIKSLPEEFCYLQSLQHLELMFSNRLESLPSNFGNLTNLRHLNLYGCGKLRMLPISFKKLMLLQNLNLEGCGKLIIKPEDFQNIKMLEFLSLSGCEQLKELPRHITNQASLREIYLNGLRQLRELPINEIEGLEYWRELESLSIGTCWEVLGIQSLKDKEKLWTLDIFRANKGSASERCIQTLQKWPEDIIVCTRAFPDASSRLKSLVFPSLFGIDSIYNKKINTSPKVVQNCSSIGDAIMLCFVINCVSSELTLLLVPSDGEVISEMKIEKGRWAWVVFTQRSTCLSAESFSIEEGFSLQGCKGQDKVERGLLGRGEGQRLVEAFHIFIKNLSI